MSPHPFFSLSVYPATPLAVSVSCHSDTGSQPDVTPVEVTAVDVPASSAGLLEIERRLQAKIEESSKVPVGIWTKALRAGALPQTLLHSARNMEARALSWRPCCLAISTIPEGNCCAKRSRTRNMKCGLERSSIFFVLPPMSN